LSTIINLPSSFLDDVVKFAEVASVTSKRALDEVGVHRQAQEKAAGLREPLLKYMISAGVVSPKMEKAAEAMLADHAATLNLLKAAVDKIQELKEQIGKQASDQGHATDPSTLPGGTSQHTKQAGDYDSINDPRVGLKTSFVRESDRPLLALIGK
jgi:hypothetical protein